MVPRFSTLYIACICTCFLQPWMVYIHQSLLSRSTCTAARFSRSSENPQSDVALISASLALPHVVVLPFMPFQVASVTGLLVQKMTDLTTAKTVEANFSVITVIQVQPKYFVLSAGL